MENARSNVTRFILTGPESTGKSVLTVGLAKYFEKNFISEYARDYVLNLKRPYNYNDVLHIAKKQIELMNNYTAKSSGFLFVDTYLIITKVWFIKVYGKYPDWIDSEISKTKNDHYLICKPDIPWVADGVRENGGKMREVLYNDYLNELIKTGLKFSVIEGNWENRLENAINKVNLILAGNK
jgi:NadR type nicotinamide-nucleotide adenylyltransferase